jgi:signal transduction histidine kinase
MAAILAFFMVRALRAFELEERRRLQEATEAKLRAQTAALEAERHVSREMEQLNEELRLTAHELSLLLDLSNLLAEPMGLQERLNSALERIVHSLVFPDAGIILLVRPGTGSLQAQAFTGFSLTDETDRKREQYVSALDLGERCVTKSVAMCLHRDGTVIEFPAEEVLEDQKCRRYPSPVTMLSLPLSVQQQVIGSILLAQTEFNEERRLAFDEFKLMVGIAQELGLAIENARLYQEAQERETMLADLLHQVVGAQEAERQRIARELHDATGQSLTAIALGLRGVETMLESDQPVEVEQVEELKSFSTSALGELRQIIADLRPSQLDDLGLAAAIQWYVQEFEKRYAIRTDFVAEGNRSRLPPEYETVLFRIVQEALTNTAKHANASWAVVRLENYPAQVCVTIKDDGRGFDLEEAHRSDRRTGWGLLGIQERTWLLGGQYEIHSKPGRGTRIRVTVPVKTEAKEDVEDQTVAG